MPSKTIKKQQVVFDYPSKNYFINKHVEEINKAYNARCLTSVYILIRKVFENIVIDILRKQFPPSTLANKELYFDTTQNRYKDFSVILRAFYDKRLAFPVGLKPVIERLYALTKGLKDSANDRTHSLYFIVTKTQDIQELDLPTILELTKEIERGIGIR